MYPRLNFRKKCFRNNGSCLYIHYFFFISKKYTQVTVKNKIDAPKENHYTTLWLLNDFPSHEMFNLLFWSRKRVSGRDASHFSEQSSYFGEKKNGAPCCPLKPRVFHQTPHFPHPWIPYPGTPAPRFSSGISVVDPDLGLRGVWGGGVFFSCPASFSSFCYFIFFCPK